MQSQSVQQLLFSNLVDRPVVVKRADFEMSSDAGLLPIRELDRRWRQRLFGILADYEDCNDHDDLRHDPGFKIVAGRNVNEDPLASQPTLSRFENSINPKMLERLRTLLVTTVIEQLRHKNNGQLPDSVTLDIDPTDVTTHGQQQLTMFHGY